VSYGTLCPDWIKEGRLKSFASAPGLIGRSIAALKCYLAITAYRDWETGSTVLSVTDLTHICGISKPTAIDAIAFCAELGVISIESRAAGNVNRYSLPNFQPSSFRKVPQDRIVEGLPSVGNRGVRNLSALKLYLVMLYLRDDATSTAVATHTKLIEYSGVRPEDVAAANGILAASGFIHIRNSSDWSRTGFPTNEYALLGDFAGKKRKMRRPAEERRTAPWARLLKA